MSIYFGNNIRERLESNYARLDRDSKLHTGNRVIRSAVHTYLHTVYSTFEGLSGSIDFVWIV